MTSVWVAPSNDFPLTSRISSPISKSALSAGDPGLKKKKKVKKKTGESVSWSGCHGGASATADASTSRRPGSTRSSGL